MSTLSTVALSIFREALRESNKTIQIDNKGIVPLSQLNLLKKYKFNITVKKIKKGYQMLVFFEHKGKDILVYATKSGALDLVTTEVEPINFIWSKNKKPKYKKTCIKFVNDNEYTKFAKWCGKFRNGQEILNKSYEVRSCSDNF